MKKMRKTKKDIYANSVQAYATYSDLFLTKKQDKEIIIEYIKTLPIKGILITLSQMSYLKINDIKIKKLYYSHLESLGLEKNINKGLFIESHLITTQGLLTVWKWMLVYGDKDKFDDDISFSDAIIAIINLCLYLADYLFEKRKDYTEEDLFYELIRNSSFNSGETLALSLTRAKAILVDIAKDESLFDKEEYLDINKDFEAKYLLTLEKYMAIVFGIFSLHINKEPFTMDWALDINVCFKNTAFFTESKEVITSMSTDFAKAESWAACVLDSSWDFTLFINNPIFVIDDIFYPISQKLLYEHIFKGVYWKIRHCYPANDTKFIRFFGKLFEKYIEKIITEANVSKKYTIIPEFKYGKNNHKKSPDLLVRYGDDLLAIEAKNYSLTVEGLTGNNRSLSNRIHAMFAEPLKQLDDRLYELIYDCKTVDLSTIKNIYLMSVTPGSLFLPKPLFDNMSNELIQNFKTPVKAIFHYDIEELEYFSNLIYRNSKRPIFRVLQNKYNNYRYIPFKNFMLQEKLTHKIPPYLSSVKNAFLDKIELLLFPKN